MGRRSVHDITNTDLLMGRGNLTLLLSLPSSLSALPVFTDG